MLKEYEFGSEAIGYIKSRLSEGDTLSAHLLSLPLENGRVTAYLPATASPVAIQRFEEGGVARTSETEPHTLTFIEAFLGGQGKRYAVFETLKRRGDPVLSSKDRFFVYGPEIYYFLTSQDRETERIRSTVRFARHYPLIGVLTSLPEGESDIRVGREVTIDVLERLAARTGQILIGAYDSEAVLIWNRN